MTKALAALPSILACLAYVATSAAASVTPVTINGIADMGFNHSEAATLAAHLADEIGGRMTNSPAMRTAERWTQEQFRAWGLKDVHAEGFDFGRGWWIESSQVRMMAPRVLELRAIPLAWTPGTNGTLQGPVVVAPLRTERHFQHWTGKLRGKIVLVSYPADPEDETGPAFSRLLEAEIAQLNEYRAPQFDPQTNPDRIERLTFGRRVDTFLAAEGALAWAQMSRKENGLVHGEGYCYRAGRTPKLPAIELTAEDYRRLARLAKIGDVTLQLDLRVHFEDADHNAYDILADLRGKDSKAGYVMAGAHLDSWVAGDGATDNGAGVAVVMEAARILSKAGVQPKRTIRFALWAGEEQGLLGSQAYVDRHLATRPPASDPKVAELGAYFSDTWPVQPLPGFNDLAAYFNIDMGSGKIRGIYTEGNFAVVPILREWLAPFASLGADAVVAQPLSGSDHVAFARLGLPAFQFIQDPLDYLSRVHHTNIDTYDHVRTNDLRQSAVILATLLLDAANNDVPLPHNVLPTQPNVTDPFHYRDPANP